MCNKCMICQENEATKTNSHIVPSFLLAMFTSYNGSCKRDTEVIFTITDTKDSVYTGRSVPETKIENLFNNANLTEERIEEELSKNTSAKDNVFCPQCEKRLADLLESPYAQHLKNNQNIADETALFFWISVVWRMSATQNYGFSLGDDLNQCLQLYLKSYFVQKEDNLSTENTVKCVPFRYKLIRCKDYSKSESGFLFAQFKDDILDIILGDFILRVFFKVNLDFPNPSFFGAEKYFAECEINKGCSKESILELSVDSFKTIIDAFVQYAANIKREAIEKRLDLIWQKIGDGSMPNNLKQKFFDLYFSDSVKIGDRHEKKRFVEVFTKILSEYFRK